MTMSHETGATAAESGRREVGSGKFDIRRVQPGVHEAVIREFWRAYLPATPAARLEWLGANPAGEAIWLFAFDRTSGEVAGMIAVTRKQVQLKRRRIDVGILGDLMVGDRYRVFGPGLPLARAALAAANDAGMSWIYTIPNPESGKLIERVGLRQIGTLMHLIRPVRAAAYLERWLPKIVARPVGGVVDWALQVISRETYSGRSCRCEETGSVDADLEQLCNARAASFEGITSVCGVRDWSWRYLQNPMYRFRMMAAVDRQSGRLAGITPFTITGKMLRVYDILVLETDVVYQLLRALRSLARREDCKAIEVAVTATNPWCAKLSRCGFFDGRADAAIYAHGCDDELFQSWAFFSGDRNI